MNARPMFDPRMLDRLSKFFPSQVTIVTPDNVPDSMGSPVVTDEIVLEGIPCVRAPFNDIIPISGERQLEMYTYDTATHRITLKGYFPQITTKMIAIMLDDNLRYNILGVEHDSHHQTTRMIVNQVTI
jgi:hypothetical protein